MIEKKNLEVTCGKNAGGLVDWDDHWGEILVRTCVEGWGWNHTTIPYFLQFRPFQVLFSQICPFQFHVKKIDP